MNTTGMLTVGPTPFAARTRVEDAVFHVAARRIFSSLIQVLKTPMRVPCILYGANHVR